MSGFNLEKQLRHVNMKIRKLEKNSNFFGRNIVKVVLFGVGFSFLAPRYSGNSDDYMNHDRDSILEQMDGNYWNAVLLCAGVYVSLALLGHFVWGIQDRRKMKRLLVRKKIILEKMNLTK